MEMTTAAGGEASVLNSGGFRQSAPVKIGAQTLNGYATY